MEERLADPRTLFRLSAISRERPAYRHLTGPAQLLRAAGGAAGGVPAFLHRHNLLRLSRPTLRGPLSLAGRLTVRGRRRSSASPRAGRDLIERGGCGPRRWRYSYGVDLAGSILAATAERSVGLRLASGRCSAHRADVREGSRTFWRRWPGSGPRSTCPGLIVATARRPAISAEALGRRRGACCFTGVP